jgi:hypothetical protein
MPDIAAITPELPKLDIVAVRPAALLEHQD